MESQLLQASTDGYLSTVKDLITKHGLNPNEVRESSGLTALHLACKHGHLDITRYLIREQNCNPETTTPNGRTPLHLACKSGHLHIARCLITDYKCNPHCTDNDGYTPLHAASESGNLDSVKYLIAESGCDPEVSDSVGNTPLHYASKSGHLNIVQCLITEFHCDLQKPNSRGSIPLHYACWGGVLPVVKYLVSEHHCSPDLTNMFGNTPVHLACLSGHLATVKYLTNECKCYPQIVNSYGLTPLHFACLNGHLHTVKFLLIQYNCNPRCCTITGNTPLHCACENGHLEIAKYLVNEHKLSPEQGSINGFTPLHSAATNGHLAVVKYLINELHCNPQAGDNKDTTPLHCACKNGHLEVAKYLIAGEYNCNPQCVDIDGITPLHLACLSGHLDVVKYLIHEQNCAYDPGCSLSQELFSEFNPHLLTSPHLLTTTDITPLHFACEYGHLEVAKHLVTECGCDPECVTSIGATPLHWACEMGQVQTVKYLVTEFKCDPMATTNDGTTPFHCACATSQLETIKYLVTECKCDPMATANDGITPFHCACMASELETIKYLVTECKCDPMATTNDGMTPFHCACKYGNLEVAKHLVTECGCDPKCVTSNRLTPLHWACEMGQLQTVKYLVTECKCDPKATTNDGATPFHCACMANQLETIKYLVTECKCDPMATTNDGATPFHFACMTSQLETIKYLVTECKCDPMATTNDGITPFHCACKTGNLEVTKYLVTECGCDPKCVTNDGYTPLLGACTRGQLETVKYLVTECNCNPNLTTEVKVPECYIERIPTSSDAHWYPFSFKDMLRGLSNTSIKGVTLLHAASSGGHLEIVKYLITECGCNPNSCDNFGITPLAYAIEWKCLEIVQYLITECKCNSAFYPKYSIDAFKEQFGSGELELPDPGQTTPLYIACCLGDFETVKVICDCNPHAVGVTSMVFVAACYSGKVDIMKYLIKCINRQVDLSPCLLIACFHGHLDFVKFLIDECGSDPQYTAYDGLTLLHASCTYMTLNSYNRNLGSNAGSSVTKIDEHGMLSYIWKGIIYPITLILQFLTTLTSASVSNPDISHTLGFKYDSRNQLELKSCKFDTFKYLVAEWKCSVQCKDKDGLTPLHYACESGQLNIVQYIYREKLSDLVHTTLSGDTPLHIACKSSQVEITEFLLSTGECDPLCKNAEGMTPLEIATSVEIRELLDQFCKGNYPLESVVKVFILGDPQAGKSSLVQALQTNSSFISSLIGRLQRIKGVRQQTAGIDSFSFSSNDFGNVVIYDFAGQREFLTSHAAFLQSSSSQLAGIFIVVANIAQCESDICQSLQYWVSFILECCAHSKNKPYIIFVGSHEDQLDRGSVDQIHSLFDKAVFSKHGTNQFYKPKGIVHLDCTRPASSGLNFLRYHLEESCNSIRKHAGKIDQRCYVLHRYVRKFYTNAGVHGCTLESISKDLEDNSHLLPSNPTELLPLFQTLHDKGQVLLLRNNQNPGKSWVITDIAALLKNVAGSIFAPYDFPAHISLGSTGVVTESRITEVFPDLNMDMIIGFLEHFEFCHRVEPGWIDLSELERSPIEKADDEFYLFPALVTSERPLHESHQSSYCSGWLIRSVEHQFFTTRFLQVLLLRLAFLFSQLQDDAALSSTKADGPAAKCKCKIWRNGISWLDINGISSLLEVRSLKTVVLSMSCLEDSRIHCVRLRSKLIQTILKSKHEFCPRVLTEELIVDAADNILLEVVDEFHSYRIKDLSSRSSERSADDNPDLTLINSDGSQGKQISELLYFEPYALLTPDLIATLFTKENAKESLSEEFISELAQWLYPFHDALVRVLKPSSSELNKKYKDICGSLDEVSKQQLMCEHIIKTWVEQQQRSASHGKLRRQLDRYSIFCGRNPLNLVCAFSYICLVAYN